MATILNPEDKNQRLGGAPQDSQQITSTPSSGGQGGTQVGAVPNAPGASVGGSQGSSGAPMVQGGAAKATSTAGHFAGIKQFINANKQGSEQLGTNIAGNVQNKVDTANQGLQQAVKQQTQQIGGAKEAITGQTYTAKVLGDKVANGSATQDEIQRYNAAIANPIQYQGPKQLELGAAEGQINQAGTEGQLAGSAQGRYQLLNQYFGKPSYSTGQNKLDLALLQSSGKGVGQLQQASQAAQNLQNNTQSARANILGQLQGLQNEQNAVGSFLNQNAQDVGARQAWANKQRSDYASDQAANARNAADATNRVNADIEARAAQNRQFTGENGLAKPAPAPIMLGNQDLRNPNLENWNPLGLDKSKLGTTQTPSIVNNLVSQTPASAPNGLNLLNKRNLVKKNDNNKIQ